MERTSGGSVIAAFVHIRLQYTMIQILLADDHPAVRRGLRTLLADQRNCAICAEACDGEEAVTLAAQHQPDIVILDVSMPRLGGIEAARRIRGILPDSEIAIVTMHDCDALRQAAFAVGAQAYLVKTEIEQHLVPAVLALAEHRAYPMPCPPAVALAS